MNETITLRPESRASTKDVIIDYMLASVDEVEQLQPALNHQLPAEAMIFLSIAMRRVRKIKQLKQNRRYLIRYFGTPRRGCKEVGCCVPQRVA